MDPSLASDCMMLALKPHNQTWEKDVFAQDMSIQLHTASSSEGNSLSLSFSSR